MKLFSSIFLLLILSINSYSQDIQSPETFLGYTLGDRFTFHHRVIDYFRHVASRSPEVDIISYGFTYEGRPLEIAIITSAQNMDKIEELRKANLELTGINEVESNEEAIPIIWLSYNVHGNEAVSSEAAMETLYLLATHEAENSEEWMEANIIIIDPCMNPDGRDRYANWYAQYQHALVNPRLEAQEHREPWPGGRANHYLFDLNRDWAWLTQAESQQRMALYRKWMPHVHVDFHEMGINSPYYFAPAAKPYHEVITLWQREFQTYVGKNNAQYFDEYGWSYFTRQVFDLLYPSYGDTWPTYNGAIGFTYEQGGSGRAGVAVRTEGGDTLTLKNRIAHHVTTGLSTIETSHNYGEDLISFFADYFQPKEDEIPYQTYVLKTAGNSHKRKAIGEFLESQQISYQIANEMEESYTGFSYVNRQNEGFSIQLGDIVVPGSQPQSRLTQVLLEPDTYLEDSITYDLTAWSLPYIYGVEAFACESFIDITINEEPDLPDYKSRINWASAPAYAYISTWNSVQDVKYLAAILQKGIKVRYVERPLTIEDQSFDRGSIVILQSDNKTVNYQQVLKMVADSMEQPLTPIRTGYASEGFDLGSNYVKIVGKPRVAILAGNGISSYGVGELWHYFEQEIQYPVSLINLQYLRGVDLNDYHVIFLPSGNYRDYKEKLFNYVKEGGRLVALERSINLFNSFQDENPETMLAEGYQLKEAKENESPMEEEDSLLQRYEYAERESLIYSVAGSIYKVSLDDSHPLAFGLGEFTHIIKRNSRIFPYLPEGAWNVGVFKEDAWTAGYTGYKLKENLKNSLAVGIENMGDGQIIYFSDSPIFRGFWYQGKILLGNAIFFDQPTNGLYGQ